MMNFRYVTMGSKLAGAFVLAFGGAVFAGNAVAAEVLAPGWGKLEYEVPTPGTYELPAIHSAAGGPVLTTAGKAADLDDFLGDKIVILNFMYTSCDDINGCPLSIFVLHTLQDRLANEPAIADKLRFISLSFDTVKDTPEVLRQYQQSHGGDAHHGHGGHNRAGAEWIFLAAKSRQDLLPMLKSYSQFVLPEVDEKGENTGKFSHLLRVFLIDEQREVRNIYSPSFLHADILLADIRSVLATGPVN